MKKIDSPFGGNTVTNLHPPSFLRKQESRRALDPGSGAGVTDERDAVRYGFRHRAVSVWACFSLFLAVPASLPAQEEDEEYYLEELPAGELDELEEAEEPAAQPEEYEEAPALEDFSLEEPSDEPEPFEAGPLEGEVYEEPRPRVVQPAERAGPASIEKIEFVKENNWGRILITTTAPIRYETNQIEPKAIALDLRNVTLRPDLQRILDVTAYESVVGAIVPTTLSSQPEPVVRVLASLRTPAAFQVDVKGNVVLFSFREPAGGAGSYTLGAREIDISSEARGTRPTFTGPRISLDFKEIDIDNVLRLLADVTGINVVADEDVTGKITVKLTDVPADQALEVVLETKGLGKSEIGDRIYRVAPKSRIQEETQKKTDLVMAEERAEPLITKVVTVNYADAGEFEGLVRDSILSERGKVKVDSRSNSMIIKDVARALDEAVALVRRLDVQTPQVIIDAKVVEANSNFLRTVGSQMGTILNLDQARGVSFGPIVQGQIGSPQVTGTGTPALNNNFLVDFPAGEVGAGRGSGVGLSLGTIGNVATVNLVLSALKESGEGRVVASPRVTALDNKEATILQGETVHVLEVTAQGTSVRPIEAFLRLRVTPHITPDGSVLLKIKLERNEPDFTKRVRDIPNIINREAETELIVRNGETVVIGGVQVRTQRRSRSGVPLLSDIPILGMLFRNSLRREQTDELIMFLTPRILNFQAVEAVETIATEAPAETQAKDVSMLKE